MKVLDKEHECIFLIESVEDLRDPATEDLRDPATDDFLELPRDDGAGVWSRRMYSALASSQIHPSH